MATIQKPGTASASALPSGMPPKNMEVRKEPDPGNLVKIHTAPISDVIARRAAHAHSEKKESAADNQGKLIIRGAGAVHAGAGALCLGTVAAEAAAGFGPLAALQMLVCTDAFVTGLRAGMTAEPQKSAIAVAAELTGVSAETAEKIAISVEHGIAALSMLDLANKGGMLLKGVINNIPMSPDPKDLAAIQEIAASKITKEMVVHTVETTSGHQIHGEHDEAGHSSHVD